MTAEQILLAQQMRAGEPLLPLSRSQAEAQAYRLRMKHAIPYPALARVMGEYHGVWRGESQQGQPEVPHRALAGGDVVSPQELEQVQRMVAIRMSINHHTDLTWGEWAERLRRRVRGLQAYTEFGERPSFDSAIYLAADAMTLLCLVDEADLADHATGEQEAA